MRRVRANHLRSVTLWRCECPDPPKDPPAGASRIKSRCSLRLVALPFSFVSRLHASCPHPIRRPPLSGSGSVSAPLMSSAVSTAGIHSGRDLYSNEGGSMVTCDFCPAELMAPSAESSGREVPEHRNQKHAKHRSHLCKTQFRRPHSPPAMARGMVGRGHRSPCHLIHSFVH